MFSISDQRVKVSSKQVFLEEFFFWNLEVTSVGKDPRFGWTENCGLCLFEKMHLKKFRENSYKLISYNPVLNIDS